MKSQLGRQAYRNMKQGGCVKGTRKSRRADHIGQRIDPELLDQAQRILAEAVLYFKAGRSWSKLHRRELRLAGYITEADQWTERGKARLALAQESASSQGVS